MLKEFKAYTKSVLCKQTGNKRACSRVELKKLACEG